MNRKGTYRRRVIAVAAGNAVQAGIEDDMHHFEVSLEHDGQCVTSLRGRDLRTPWVNCGLAAARLDELVGTEISTGVHRRRDLPDPAMQCTHLYDLALIAIAQAARGGRRQYDITAPDPEGGRLSREFSGASDAPEYADVSFGILLHRDRQLLLEWRLQGAIIAAPPAFAGMPVRRVAAWAAENCDDEMLEAVRVLRRGLHVSYSRDVDMSSFARAADMPAQFGTCYTFQPVHRERALRNADTQRDFSDRPDELLAEFTSTPDA